MPTAKKPAAKVTKAEKTEKAKKPKAVKETAAKPKKAEETAIVKPAKKTPAKTEKAPQKAPKSEAAPQKAKPAKKTSSPKEDTGSVDFQIDNFSQKIKLLAKHLKTHPHDFDSRRGLLIMVGKRRRLLNYLKKSDQAKYEEVAKSLKLKA